MVDATLSFRTRARDRMPVFNTAGAVFGLLGRAPLTFFALSACAVIPSLVLFLPHPPPFFDEKASLTWLSAEAIIKALVSLLAHDIMMIPMIFIADHVVENRAVSLAQAVRLGLRRCLPALAAALLITILYYVGLALLIVPGVIVGCIYAVVMPACVLEELGPVASMKRSAALTKSNRWQVFGVRALFYGPFVVGGLGTQAFFNMRDQAVLGQWIAIVLQVAWMPLTTLASFAIYAELRRLNENPRVAAIFD